MVPTKPSSKLKREAEAQIKAEAEAMLNSSKKKKEKGDPKFDQQIEFILDQGHDEEKTMQMLNKVMQR